jgi:hypothetical protein
MLVTLAKTKALEFFRYNFQPRFESLHAEQIFQGLFNQQCLNHQIKNDFYPVGAAANYGLMYLIVRILKELPVQNIVELGSGQSTILIDRIKDSTCTHTAYESNALWAGILRSRLTACDYRERPLCKLRHGDVSYQGYDTVDMQDFDFLLVDGPNGTDRHSRFGCVPLIENNQNDEFIVVADDAERPGEQETIRCIADCLAKKGIDFKLNYVAGRTTQAVITTPKYRAASYFF